MTRVEVPERARYAARLTTVVVLPTPPFWLVHAVTLITGTPLRVRNGHASFYQSRPLSKAYRDVADRRKFHVKQRIRRLGGSRRRRYTRRTARGAQPPPAGRGTQISYVSAPPRSPDRDPARRSGSHPRDRRRASEPHPRRGGARHRAARLRTRRGVGLRRRADRQPARPRAARQPSPRAPRASPRSVAGGERLFGRLSWAYPLASVAIGSVLVEVIEPGHPPDGGRAAGRRRSRRAGSSPPPS